MPIEAEFSSKQLADDFREEHPEQLAESDDRRLRTVRLQDDAPEWLVDRAEAAQLEAQAGDQSLPGEQQPLTDAERESLDRQHATWSWQDHGFEAMRAKGALKAEGATEWMDFYEPGEGASGALQNFQASKEMASQTGARVGAGDRVDVDEDDRW